MCGSAVYHPPQQQGGSLQGRIETQDVVYGVRSDGDSNNSAWDGFSGGGGSGGAKGGSSPASTLTFFPTAKNAANKLGEDDKGSGGGGKSCRFLVLAPTLTFSNSYRQRTNKSTDI